MENFHPKNSPNPLHVGIIPDGGRRWAEKNNASLVSSYAVTVQKIAQICDYLFENKVEQVSIYVSSVQNYRRNNYEVDSITNAIINGLRNEAFELAKKHDLSIKIVGSSTMFSEKLKNVICESDICNISSSSGKIINLCIAYNPIEEIMDAVSKTSRFGIFTDNLWIPVPLDMVIRSGDVNLISNFMPLQAGYARIYFISELFNDIEIANVENIYSTFTKLNRKYGE